MVLRFERLTVAFLAPYCKVNVCIISRKRVLIYPFGERDMFLHWGIKDTETQDFSIINIFRQKLPF